MDKGVESKLPEIVGLFKEYKAESAFLFGSAATDNATLNSDVDFLFSFPKEMHFEEYADNYFSLLDKLQELLNKDVDLVAEKTLSNQFLIQKINSQKIQLF